MKFLIVAASVAGENALAALETEWADVATMLKMPDAKIAYYLYSAAHVSAALRKSNVRNTISLLAVPFPDASRSVEGPEPRVIQQMPARTVE